MDSKLRKMAILASMAVILLVALEDMSYDAIAQTLAIPRGTVMSRLFRGREHLRRLMAPESGVTHLRVVP